MKKKKIIIGVVSSVVIAGLAAGITIPLVIRGNKPEPIPPTPPTPKINPIPENEFIIKNGILMGLKRDWSEYNGYTQILIHSSVRSINTDALASNKKNGYMPSTITNLTFEETANADSNGLIINNGAFAGDEYLETIVFPQRTQYIGENVFADCKNVKALDFSSWTDERAKDVNPFGNAGIFTNFRSDGKVITTSETVRDSLYYMLTPITGGLNKNWFEGVNIQSNEMVDTDDVRIKYDIVNDDYAVITSLSHTEENEVENWTIPTKFEVENTPYYVLGVAPFAAKNFNGIKKISIADDSILSAIGARAFDSSNDVEEVNLKYPSGTYADNGVLEMIDTAAFANMPSLKKIQFPNSLKSIGSWCFEFDSLLSDANMEFTSVSKIMPGTFYDCRKIRNLDLLKSVTTGGVTWIGSYAFALSSQAEDEEGISSLSKIKFCRYIGDNAFEYQNLGEITLNDRLVYLGDFAFMNCKNLTKIEFPSCIGYFGAGALSYTNVASDTGAITCKQIEGKEANYATATASPTIVNADKTEIVYAADMWEIPTDMRNTVKSFAPYAFAGTKTRNDVLDWSAFTQLTTIGDYAFAGLKATQVVEIHLPNTIRTIGNHVFSKSDVGIELFNEIANLPNLSSWGDHLFSNCEKLDAYDTALTPAVTRIPEGTFRQSSLKNLTIKKNVLYIDDQAFGQCTNLELIDVSDFNTVPKTWYKEDEKPFDFTLTKNLTIKIKDASVRDNWKQLFEDLGLKEGSCLIIFTWS